MLEFAHEWIAAWNSHSLPDILSHYDDDVVFYSPLVKKLNNDPSGGLRGKAALEAYFTKGLAAFPDLHFDLYHVLEGVNSVVLYYKSVNNRLSAELMVLNERGKVIEVRAHYTEQ
ncbi:nuclear transport factor 2 family protein [Chitinophaga parva]|uniref:Nuclear transport factor 2 family protein n=1 Tax=Chitinophaga parva TaxID=2169414 RepID=A0A2T7BMN9_9BACT|nr:nuclear transport factor 2 family protein [Chitinophaga parva]PUZ28947.1 nuclear transport factor 2 family protein [Chitinophaga parva]